MSQVARHTFASPSVGKDAFRVLRFEGVEEISQPFRFVIHLVSDNAAIPFADVLDAPATLTMIRGDDESPVHGIVSEFQQLHMAGGQSDFRYVYRAVLVPRLWRLSLAFRSRIFQNQTVEDIVKSVLAEAEVDHRFKLTGKYEPREYTTQYQESDLDFVQRLLEFEGIRYHVDHTSGADEVVMSDDASDAVPIEGDDKLAYSHGDGLVTEDDVETIKKFRAGHRVVRQKAVLKDYDYMDPTTEILAELDTTPKSSRGQISEALTDTIHPTIDRNKHLTSVRAEEAAATAEVMTGTGDCLRFRSGFRFNLARHFRADLNQTYLLTWVEHEGTQPDAAEALDADHEGSPTGYANRFRCVPAAVRYRPARRTPVPKLPGVLTAKVESKIGSDVGAGEYAPIDKEGRYRVRFPFDLGKAGTQQATQPVRLAQPYSGPGYGQHFPVHKDAEMVIACVDGNVDRILGLATVPNPSQKSPVTSANAAENTVKTAADNMIVLKDTQNHVGIELSSPTSNSRIHIGAADGSVEGIQLETEGTTLVHGGGSVWVKAGETSPESLMGGDLGDVGIAMTAVDAAVGLILSAMGARLHNASFRAGLLGANLAGTVLGTANTAAGTGLGIGLSGIFMTSPGGILMATSAGISAYAGMGGIGLTSATGIDLTASTLGMNLLVGAGGINIGVGHGDIATTAALGDIATQAKTGEVTTKAMKNVETKSDTASIKSEAAMTVEHKAGTSVKIESGTDTVIKANTKLTLQCGPTKLEMTPDGKVTLSSGVHSLKLEPAGITLNSVGSFTAKSAAAMSLESSMSAEIKGVIEANVSGATVNVKGGVLATVKGAMVQIN